MKISVVIPAYNSGTFILGALDSIASQSVPVHEIIVVDDGSSDETAEKVQQWQGELPLTLIRQQNHGPSAARNRGIEQATGDWIAFLDADDRWTPRKIEDQLRTLESCPELALVASDMSEIDPEGHVRVPSMLEAHHLLEYFRKLDGRPIPNAMAFLLKKNFIPTGTVLVRHATLREAGLFNTRIRYGEDLELWSRIAAHHPIACLPVVHMLRTRHTENATSQEIPMLLDLVEVHRNIRKAEAQTLREQNMDPDFMVAEALWTAGYWYFSRGRHDKSRPLFLQSLREKPSHKALVLLAASLLPPAMVHTLKKMRRGIKSVSNSNG